MDAKHSPNKYLLISRSLKLLEVLVKLHFSESEHLQETKVISQACLVF